MFMFWSKRTLLTKRLLKAKVRGEHETECETQENNHHIVPYSIGSTSESSSKHHPPSGSGTASPSTTLGVGSAGKATTTTTTTTNCCCCCYCCCFTGSEDNRRNRHHHQQQQQQQQRYGNASSASIDDTSNDNNGRVTRCKDLLKSLKENQLEMLLAAVESYGADLSGCVLVPRRRRRADGDLRTVENATNDNNTAMGCREDKKTQQQTQRSSARHHHHHNQHSQRLQQRLTRGERRSDDNDENAIPLEERNPTSLPLADAAIATTTTTTNSTCSRFGRGDRQSSHRSRNSAGATPASTDRNTGVEPHLLCCQIWRWPDLADSDELKRLPVCHSDEDPVYVCCNPYHWSRLCKPESPPPPYCLIADRLRPEDRAPSEGGGEGDADAVINRHRNANPPPLPGSLTTNGEDASGQREWCTLAYWELGGRVGRLFPVEPSTVNVFDSLLDGDGLCLATLAENHSTSPAIQRTRSKIGLGLTLSDESDGVWAYNRSENPIFVNSPTLDDPESRTLLVYRVPPGFCLNIFDRAKNVHRHYHHQQQSSTSLSSSTSPNNAAVQGLTSGPVDVNSVRISFAKGWGPKYSRQEVTSCPCWLEVLLAPCR
ncbi:mothers against decapentaplegic homolog 2 [Neodiprion fabricii]|uniref:mothers against decapentaplegic homolog 2 n=1 Tax=Neodiprion fabricii TaxID=2872261 RepID=UPI001ED8C708|nr:mothers against decapentaplegic homolog 2 [Neodiprion fabricii]